MIAKAIHHEKGLSHYGAVILPALMVEEMCNHNQLGWYYVQRRWRDIEGPAGTKRAFDYCLGMDPGNAVYYSWLKTQLGSGNLLSTFHTPGHAARINCRQTFRRKCCFESWFLAGKFVYKLCPRRDSPLMGPEPLKLHGPSGGWLVRRMGRQVRLMVFLHHSQPRRQTNSKRFRNFVFVYLS